jgi:hypothetical protein
MIKVMIRDEKTEFCIVEEKVEVLPRVGEFLDIYWKEYVVTKIKHYIHEQVNVICIYVNEL